MQSLHLNRFRTEAIPISTSCTFKQNLVLHKCQNLFKTKILMTAMSFAIYCNTSVGLPQPKCYYKSNRLQTFIINRIQFLN